jgi:hypothetical protein
MRTIVGLVFTFVQNKAANAKKSEAEKLFAGLQEDNLSKAGDSLIHFHFPCSLI